MNPRLRVLLFGNHSEGDGYPRLRVLAAGLREHGVEVLETRVPLLEGEGARARAVSSPLGFLRASIEAAKMQARLRRAYHGAPEHDAVIAGYPGHAAVKAARRANRDRRRPILLDAFFSLHDTVVNDRRLAPARSLRARALRHLDVSSCAAADLVFTDTGEHARYFADELGVPPGKILVVPVGAMPFGGPSPGRAPRPPGRPLEVLFFGTFVPLQGAPVIVEALAALRGGGVRLTMVGRGQDLPAARERAASLGLSPSVLEWVEGFLPRADLDRRLAAADVSLGIFGTSAKASRVVPCKVFDGLAAGRPVVTADTPAARALVRDGEEALLVPAGDPAALASALERLRDDPGLRARLAEGARRLWGARLAPGRVVEGLMESLERLCRDRPRTA